MEEKQEKEQNVPTKPQEPSFFQEDEKSKKPKKSFGKKWIILLIVIAIAVGGGLWYFLRGSSSSEVAYVMAVSDISSNSYISGSSNRFTGVIEPQSTKNVNFDSSKTLGELFVKEGDVVKAGDRLFSYSVSDMSLELQQAKVELESILQSINEQNAKITDLQNQKNAASSDQQLEFSIQIQSAQTELSDLKLSQQKKQLEIDAKQKEIDNAIVTSPIDGTIQTINDSSNASYSSGSSDAYIVIVADGNFLVKCTVSEMNVGLLTTGEAMIIRSRVDSSSTWTGTISSIDTGTTVSDNNSGYYSSDSGENTASKYYFYVAPNDTTNMMIGQHVTVEADPNGGEDVKTYDGILLGSYYICDLDSNPYVWMSDNGKLKKQSVTIGEYNESTDEYEITEGLTTSDYIAYPDETYTEGMKAESMSSAITDNSESDEG